MEDQYSSVGGSVAPQRGMAATSTKNGQRTIQSGKHSFFYKPVEHPNIFDSKKKPGKWRLSQDLRAVSALIALMGTQQNGIPNPAMIPETWELLITDLKDYFFPTALHPHAAPRFAFSLPSLNNSEPMQSYHWIVLPQERKNSPTICQFVVASALQPVQQPFSKVLLYLYVNDTLLAADDPAALQNCFAFWCFLLVNLVFVLQQTRLKLSHNT